MKTKEIKSVRVRFDLKGTYKDILFADGSILSEPISSEEGALIEAQERF